MTVDTLERRRLRRKRRRLRKIRDLCILALIIAGIVTAVALLVHKKPPSAADVQREVAVLDWVELDLLPVNAYSRPGTPLEKVNAVVIHYVGNPDTTAAQNRSYYGRLADSGETYASSNFLVGLDGEILECVPVDEVAYCSNWRNGDTISIECCHPDETGKFNEDTYASLVRLTAWLCEAFDLDASDLLRHYDITGKICPKYFVDNPDAWEAFKADVQNGLDELKTQAENG